ncbi:MAG: ABC transporter ATP-binding protein [Chloroflexaceae bacterium]|nr:ABC transporter ATP-binding protein [Chloroflexaceae bacterium]
MATFRDILGYFSNYRGIALASIASSSLFEISNLVTPYAIGQILNVLSNQPVDRPVQKMSAWLGGALSISDEKWLSLGFLVGIIFLVTVVRAPIYPWVSSWYHWAIALRARYDASVQTLQKILTLPLGFYDEHNPGRIAARFTKGITNHTWSYPEIAGQLIPKLMEVLGIFVVILWIDWRIAIAFGISFITVLGYNLRHLYKLIQLEEKVDRYQENTDSRTSEIITNIKTVKAFATEANELERQRQRFKRELDVIIYRIHRGYVVGQTWHRAVVQTCYFLVLLFALIATVRGQMSLGHFITVLTITSIAYAELDPIIFLAETFARRYISMLRFHDLLQLPAGTDAASLTQESVAANPYRFTGKVEFANLSFGYSSDRPILKEINLLIEPCQTVALVGRSGSGKSTLIKLLFRYFEPNSGRILMDGEDVRNLDIARYRRRLAIVHQEVDVFNGTLLDNLVYGNPAVSFTKVEEACRIAKVDEFVHELPQGYYTVVGERGVRLSGGQRQRLGIARALIVDPDVLVFDEATSSLDYESEKQIQLAMRSIFGTRTTLVIAHRLSTVREADKIVVLANGQIAEVGTHQQLLDRGGIYQRLHALQETGELRI